jgi:hypothetical protein
MTFQISRPEIVAMINERIQTGGFKNAEDVILQALLSSSPDSTSPQEAKATPAKNMVELFAPLRGLNLDFESDRR